MATPYRTEVVTQGKAAAVIAHLGADIDAPAGKHEGAKVYDFGGTWAKWIVLGGGKVKLEHYSGSCPC